MEVSIEGALLGWLHVEKDCLKSFIRRMMYVWKRCRRKSFFYKRGGFILRGRVVEEECTLRGLFVL